MTAATLICPSCRAELGDNNRFCHQCGARITLSPKPTEYKQVTVLFADVVRSMDIAAAVDMERLREVMTELLERLAAVLRRYGGTVEYNGDGVMALFGAPIALEDHAFRACLAAMCIQEEADRLASDVQRRDGVDLRVRVGLNSGQVIAGEIGSGSLGYAATGEHVGMAQRIESVAPPGGVMLSESTARLVENLAILAEPERVHIKGANDPMPVRRLVDIKPRRGLAGRAEASLVGRRWEMAALDAIVDRAIGGRGGVVNVVGPPGIGKSRAAREAAVLAATRGIEVFWAFCESHARDIPFYAVRRLLRAVNGIEDLDDPAARARVRERVPNADPQDLFLLDDLLGIADPDVPLPQINPDARRRRLTALINSMTLARTRPTLFIIEDAHWIDAVSESMLADFLAVIPRTASMVLITSRPQYERDLMQAHGAQTIALAPLDDSDTTAMLGELLGPDPSVGELAATIADRAAGNPFFAEEMVRELVQRGALAGEQGGYVCRTDVAELSVPATVQAAIEARIDRLTASAKRTLNAASVIGARFGPQLLAALEIDPIFDELLGAELIDQVRFTPYPEYAFCHPLIRAVAYESQLKSDRAQWHWRLATAIQEYASGSVEQNAALIAEHLEAAGELRAAYGWHMRAGAWSTNRDVDAARVSWERARRVADALPADDADQLSMRIATRTMLCATDWQGGAVQKSRGRFAELRELCGAAGDKVSLAIGLSGLAAELLFAGRSREGARLVSEQMALLESIGDPTLTIGLAPVAFLNWCSVGELDEVLRWSHTIIDLAAGDPAKGAGFGMGSPLAAAFAFRGVARCWLGHPGWRQDFDDALAMARNSDPATLAFVVSWAYGMEMPYGALRADDSAVRVIEEAVQIAEGASHDGALALIRLTLGVALLYRGTAADRHRGFELMMQARESQRQHAPSLRPVTDLLVAQAWRDDRDGAIAMTRKAVEELHQAGRFGYVVLGISVLVKALLERGAETDLTEAEVAIDRLAKLPDDRSAMREITLLRLRAASRRPRRRCCLRGLSESLSRVGGIAWLRRAHGLGRGDDRGRAGMTAVGMACASCGTGLRENAKFCDECGAPTSMSGDAAKYKQVTVLFADVVRSMEIAANLDMERLREIMTEIVERSAAVARRYGGTVEYNGDGVMALFGAPVALEDHAFRACLAALDIQQEATRLAAEVQQRDSVDLQLRVGLDSGRVIAGEIGSGSLGYAATGEHVGMAQRMEAAAPPGEVMLSESTALLVEHTVLLTDPEWVHIKGADEPVRAQRLIAIGPRDAQVGRAEASLVGRRWEMAALDAIVDRTIAGRGSVVNVVGPAGIGKSRVAREAAALAAARGVEVFWTFCESHARDIPFHAATRLLRASSGVADFDSQTVRKRVRARMPTDADPLDLLLLDDLLGIAEPNVALPEIDPDTRRRRLTALINTAWLARTEPTLFIIEDAHWVDAVSESMLADFLAVIPRTPAMVLITSRPDYEGTLMRVHGAQTIALVPLDDSDTAALLGELLGSDSSVGELVAVIAERAAGNPFFAEEMVRELAQRGVLTGERGGYVCRADVAEVDVPATVQAAIAARIDRLPTSAKQTLAAASVIGARFGAALLAALGIDAVIDELITAELIDQVRFTSTPEYAFHHPLIRAVAYESQLKSDRAEWHRRLAAAIQERAPGAVEENAALIAEHLEAAGELHAAYGWHMRAGARSTNRDVSAARLSWERARRIADALPDDAPGQLSMRIAPRTMLCATDWQGHQAIQQSEGRFAELRELCSAAGDKVSLAIGMTGLATELLNAQRTREGSRLASEQMALLESIGDPTLTIGLSFVAFVHWLNSGEFDELLRWSQTVVDLAGGDPAKGAGFGVGSPLAVGVTFRGIARWWLGRPGWHQDLDDAVAMARNSDPATLALVLTWTYGGVVYGVLRPDDSMLREIEAAVRIAQRACNDHAVFYAEYALGAVLLYRDAAADRDRGLELMVRAREWQREQAPSLVPVTDLGAARERARRGDRDAAIPVMRKAVDELHQAERVGYGVWGTGLLVETLLERGAEGDLTEAQEAIDRLANLQADQGSAMLEITLLRLSALLARARGDEVAYPDLVIRYCEMAKSLGFEGHIAWAEEMIGSG